MNKRSAVVLFLALGGLMACTALQPVVNPGPDDQKKMVPTGSNIPKRDQSGVTLLGKEAIGNIDNNAAVQFASKER